MPGDDDRTVMTVDAVQSTRSQPGRVGGMGQLEGIFLLAAMKPRTGDGPMEVTKEGRSLIMRVPLEGGGRLVVELNAAEAANLKECLVGVTE